jgi:hypothetical protein
MQVLLAVELPNLGLRLELKSWNWKSMNLLSPMDFFSEVLLAAGIHHFKTIDWWEMFSSCGKQDRMNQQICFPSLTSVE